MRAVMRELVVVSNHAELVAVLPERAEALDVSNLVLDEVTSLPSGYGGKVQRYPEHWGELYAHLKLTSRRARVTECISVVQLALSRRKQGFESLGAPIISTTYDADEFSCPTLVQ
jgi:hypothetical protein